MADPFSIIKEIVEFGFKIKSLREKVKHNAEDCRWIDDFLGKVRAIAKHLQGSPNMEDDLMRDMVEGLRQALERASKFVANYEGTWFVSRAFNAGGIAEKLRGVCLNVQLNMSAVQLANDTLNNSVLVDVKENVDQLRADVTHNNLVMAELKKNVDQLRADVTNNNSMLKIVTAQRDVHLQEEMAKLVKDYQISSEIIHKKETKKTGVASSQTKNERATKKTGVASSQNKNKTGAKKTDVAR